MEINTKEVIISPVQIVTIKSKTPLFKGEDQANAIEKIEVEENGFSLVAQKDLYEIGEKAVYIQPDYSLSDITLFDSFIRPNGDPKKSRLGSNFRIRAIKFNLHTGDYEPTYSVGILLPLDEVTYYLSIKWGDPRVMVLDSFKACAENNKFPSHINIVEELGIKKWEEPEGSSGGTNGTKSGSGREFPSGIYKTDETNIKNLWGHIEKKIGYPVRLIGSQKVDGSSISLIFNKGEISVGSRTYIKKDKIEIITGVRELSLWERFKVFFRIGTVDHFTREWIDNDDDFIKLAKPYIEKIRNAYGDYFANVTLIFRGEANGKKWKGSGNKNNPTATEEPNIRFFGIDDYSSGVAVKAGEDDFNNIISLIGLSRCPVLFDEVFESREEIEKTCAEIFKNNMIEGIVLRTEDSKFSGKFMNDHYDSIK